jgi:hypothetical protein
MVFTQSYGTFQAHSIVKVLWLKNEPGPNIDFDPYSRSWQMCLAHFIAFTSAIGV